LILMSLKITERLPTRLYAFLTQVIFTSVMTILPAYRRGIAYDQVCA
jgi:hypothetical protein